MLQQGPEKVWPVQNAKQRLSELLQAAVTEGPQMISKRGQEFAVVLSVADFNKLRGHSTFKDFLASAPDFDVLELTRSRETGPPVVLE